MHILFKLAASFMALWLLLIPAALASIEFRGGRYYHATQTVWLGSFCAAMACFLIRGLLWVWAQ